MPTKLIQYNGKDFIIRTNAAPLSNAPAAPLIPRSLGLAPLVEEAGPAYSQSPAHAVRYWDFDNTMCHDDAWLGLPILKFFIKHQGPVRGIHDALCSQGVAMPGAKPHLTFEKLNTVFADMPLFMAQGWYQDTVGTEVLAGHPELSRFYRIALSFAKIEASDLEMFRPEKSRYALILENFQRIAGEVEATITYHRGLKTPNLEEIIDGLEQGKQERAERQADKAIADRRIVQAKWLAFFCRQQAGESDRDHEARCHRFLAHVQRFAQETIGKSIDSSILVALREYWLGNRKPGLTLIERSFWAFKRSFDALGVTLNDVKEFVELIKRLKGSASSAEAQPQSLADELSALIRKPGAGPEADHPRISQYLAILEKFHPLSAYPDARAQRESVLNTWSDSSQFDDDDLMIRLFLRQLNVSKAAFMRATEEHLQLQDRLAATVSSRAFIDDIPFYGESVEHQALNVSFVLSAVEAVIAHPEDPYHSDIIERYVALALTQVTPLQLMADCFLYQEGLESDINVVQALMSHGLFKTALLAVHGSEFKNDSVHHVVDTIAAELKSAVSIIQKEQQEQGSLLVLSALLKKLLACFEPKCGILSNEFLAQLQAAIKMNGARFSNPAIALTRLFLLALTEMYGEALSNALPGFSDQLKDFLLKDDPECDWAWMQLGDLPKQFEGLLQVEMAGLSARIPSVRLAEQRQVPAVLSPVKQLRRGDRRNFTHDLGEMRIAMEEPEFLGSTHTAYLTDLSPGFSRRASFTVEMILEDPQEQLKTYLIRHLRLNGSPPLQVVDVLLSPTGARDEFRVDSLAVLENNRVVYYSQEKGVMKANELLPKQPLCTISIILLGSDLFEYQVSFAVSRRLLCLGPASGPSEFSLPDYANELTRHVNDPLLSLYETLRGLTTAHSLEDNDRAIIKAVAYTLLNLGGINRSLVSTNDWQKTCKAMQALIACVGDPSLSGALAQHYRFIESAFIFLFAAGMLTSQFLSPRLFAKQAVEADYLLFGSLLDLINKGLVAGGNLLVFSAAVRLNAVFFQWLRGRQRVSLGNDSIIDSRDVGRLLQSDQPLLERLVLLLRSAPQAEAAMSESFLFLQTLLRRTQERDRGSLLLLRTALLNPRTFGGGEFPRGHVEVIEKARAIQRYQHNKPVESFVKGIGITALVAYALYEFITGVMEINNASRFDDQLQQSWAKVSLFMELVVSLLSLGVMMWQLPVLLTQAAEVIAGQQGVPKTQQPVARVNRSLDESRGHLSFWQQRGSSADLQELLLKDVDDAEDDPDTPYAGF